MCVFTAALTHDGSWVAGHFLSFGCNGMIDKWCLALILQSVNVQCEAFTEAVLPACAV